MKKLILVLLISLVGSFLWAQVFPVEIIFKNGEPDKRINFVFLSDGYQQAELGKFIADVNKVVNDIFSQSPFKEYRNYFNAYAIRVPSPQSGANHPRTSNDSDCAGVPVAVVNNYFGSTFDVGGIHRLLVPQKNVAQVLAASFPEFDQAFVLVNSPYYGGSGGIYSASSAHVASSEVSFHEIGHSFAHLADEYWAGANYADEKPNMTRESSTTKVKWKNWLGVGGTGIYPHEESPSWYRPHQSCKMRVLNKPFCPVCREAFLERIHEMVTPLNEYAPVASSFEPKDNKIDFSVDVLENIPNTIKTEWRKGATVLAKNTDKISVSLNLLNEQVSIVEAEVIDTSSLVRTKPHFSSHVYTVSWKITKTKSGVEIVPVVVTGKVITDPITGIGDSAASDVLQLYPNPFIDEITVSYTLLKNTSVAILITDASGHRVKEISRANHAAGQYHHTFSVSDLNLNQGTYFFTLRMDNIQVVKKAIRQ